MYKMRQKKWKVPFKDMKNTAPALRDDNINMLTCLLAVEEEKTAAAALFS